MQGLRFTYSVHLHGTLSADAGGEFKLPCAASLVAVSFGCAGAAAATVDFGPSTDADGIGNDKAVGQSGVPNLFEAADFNGALMDQAAPYHFAKGDILTWTITHASAVDTSLVFVFTEG